MKSQFTPEELYEQFAEHISNPYGGLEDVANEIEAVYSAPTPDYYPVDEWGQVDFIAIAQAVQSVADNQLSPLGEQWLEWMEKASDTEDPQTAITMNERLEELEAQLPPMFLAGLSVALEWTLKQALEQVQNEPPNNPHAIYRGDACPACGSGDTESNPGRGNVQIDGDQAWQEMVCNTCGATWNDIYNLTGYAELEVPHAEPA